MIYLCVAFPRSGTTGFMQACEAGGMEVVNNPERAAWLARRANLPFDDYESHAGYESTHQERKVVEWPRQHEGKVVKVVTPWLGDVAVAKYRVAFLRRAPEESQQSLIAARYGDVPLEFVRNSTEEALKALKNRKDVVQLHEIWYDDLLADPKYQLQRLGWPMDYGAAAKAIDPSKKKFYPGDLAGGV